MATLKQDSLSIPLAAYVNSDGVKTRAQLLNELFALIDMSKITYSSKFVVGILPFRVGYLMENNNNYHLTYTISDFASNLGPVTGVIKIQNGSSTWKEYYGNTSSDLSSDVFPAGSRVAILY